MKKLGAWVLTLRDSGLIDLDAVLGFFKSFPSGVGEALREKLYKISFPRRKEEDYLQVRSWVFCGIMWTQTSRTRWSADFILCIMTVFRVST